MESNPEANNLRVRRRKKISVKKILNWLGIGKRKQVAIYKLSDGAILAYTWGDLGP